MRVIRVVICDDDPSVSEYYANKLQNLAKKHKVSLELQYFTSGKSLLFEFSEPGYQADVIFIDINMPGMSGIEVSQKLRELQYQNEIVFFTCSREHFIEAFDVYAMHYVVKGQTTDERFEKIFIRALEATREKDREYMLCSAGGDSVNIAIDTISYFKVQRKIITVYYEENKEFEFYSSLDKIEKQLESNGFFRIHKSFLVSLNEIERITAREVTLYNQAVLPLSKKNYPILREVMKKRATVTSG